MAGRTTLRMSDVAKRISSVIKAKKVSGLAVIIRLYYLCLEWGRAAKW